MQQLKKIIFGSIAFAAGTPSYASQPKECTSTITDNGTGNVAINLVATEAVAAADCAVVASPRATLAASGLVSIGCTHTSDVIKTFTILQEGAAGAASALADVNFDFAIFVRDNI